MEENKTMTDLAQAGFMAMIAPFLAGYTLNEKNKEPSTSESKKVTTAMKPMILTVLIVSFLGAVFAIIECMLMLVCLDDLDNKSKQQTLYSFSVFYQVTAGITLISILVFAGYWFRADKTLEWSQKIHQEYSFRPK